MIRNTITETRGSIATPFYEFTEGHIDKYKSPLPGSGIHFRDNMAIRSLTSWFSTIDELIVCLRHAYQSQILLRDRECKLFCVITRVFRSMSIDSGDMY